VTEPPLAGERPAISEVPHPKLAAWLTARGEPAYRADQVLAGVHRPEVDGFAAMSELPAQLRSALGAAYRFSTIEGSHVLEADGGMTAKAVHELSDGQRVESVLMRYAGRGGAVARTTICISSQAGCAVGCPFCATGQAGFGRQLTPGEIVDQVLHWHRDPWLALGAEWRPGAGSGHYNIVFMGLGEPLNNTDRVFEAVRLLNDPERLGIRLTQALQSFDDTRERWLGLVDARPELNVELANTFGWIAKTRELLGEFDAAIAAQRAKIEALGRMPGAASNRRVQHALANAGYEVGRLQLCLGRQVPALQAARGALGQLESLRALDPSNMEWLAHLAFARVSLAEAQLASGEGALAREGLERAAAETAQLMATDAMQRKWHITLRGSLLALQAKQALVEARPFPRGQLEDYLAAVERAESAGGRLEPDQVRIVSSVELMLGDLRVRESERLAAPRPWEAAAQRLQSLAARGEVGAATLLAHAHLRLGAVQEARALADRIESSTYRHPAYADLRQRLKHAAGAAAVQQ
jgi:hypothetical protein